MNQPENAHIEPSKHSTDEVDEKLREVERKISEAPGAGAPTIKPIDLGSDGKPATETQANERI